MGKITSVAAIAALLIALFASPGAALAAPYTVNSTGDAPDKEVGIGGCETAIASECTLRAAIQESNASPGTKDTIGFLGFEGRFADTINLGSGFPEITDPVTINGGSCLTELLVMGPCVGVNGPNGGFGLVVLNADGTTIEGLAVTGALTGIVVVSSLSFTAKDNWLGVRPNGFVAGNNTGIYLSQESNDAVIGTAVDGNLFAYNNDVGLDLLGASGATIQGNFFGVAPDGTTQAANGENIEITDTTAGGGFEAKENVVGAVLSTAPGGSAGTTACDGGCNVISGATTFGIDLNGDGAAEDEAPASGAQIIGNHIGFNMAGTGVIANTTAGISVGGADKIVIGGPTGGHTNHINGGLAGVRAGTAVDDLVVQGNMIGLNHSGVAMLAPPTQEGISVDSEGASETAAAARISNNRISMGGGSAIALENGGASAATISENTIGRGVNGQGLPEGGANFGILLRATGSDTGHTIEDNVIENSRVAAIRLEAPNNSVIGNEIVGAEESGIEIESVNGVGNTIGGNTPAEQNEISGTDGNAIETGPAATEDDFLRNIGSGNTGMFIDLGGDGPGNISANGEIQTPSIGAATPGGVSGTAVPGATVRVFEKATAAPGEIEAFIGEVKADAGGNWALAFAPALVEGTHIGVHQTGPDGTSELAQATVATPTVPPPPGGGGAGGPAPLPAADRTPPQTRITKGPKGRSSKRKAKFRFSASEARSRFECKLDRKRFRSCRSPKTYGGLRPGRHTFRVRATDGAGNRDRSPAVKKFTVLE